MSIKNKLITIMMLTCIAALILTVIGFVAWESHTLRKSTIQNLSMQAKIISENCKAALASDDPHHVKEALAKLCVNPSITYACVRDRTGKVFSTYHRDPDDESIYLNMIVYENIVETITYQVYGAALSKLAASGFLKCAWDEKLNDMVFWVSDK